MKFTDGRWMLRPGVQAFHPVEVLDEAISAARGKVPEDG